ncbi:MAG TPA: hypothetical protein VNO81_13710 [Candidatus Nitrosotenuis sp.]|nr:hypothetical protein [Candidatus Nitrosotenuis sp.]
MWQGLPGLAVLALLLAAGCASRPAPTPLPPLVNVSYQGQALPERVENLSGTALYAVASDLESQLLNLGARAPAGARAFFILLNPKDPQQGVLVRAAERLPDEVRLGEQNSKIVSVTGRVRTLEAPGLAAYIQEKHGISLARDAEGRPQWIDNQAPLDLQAPEGPQAQSPPAGSPASPGGTPGQGSLEGPPEGLPGSPAASAPGSPGGSTPGSPAGSTPGSPAGSAPGSPAGSVPGSVPGSPGAVPQDPGGELPSPGGP